MMTDGFWILWIFRRVPVRLLLPLTYTTKETESEASIVFMTERDDCMEQHTYLIDANRCARRARFA
jgi:hypothetical protein